MTRPPAESSSPTTTKAANAGRSRRSSTGQGSPHRSSTHASRSSSTARSTTKGRGTVGTPSRSYLGVPIVVGSKAIGAISVQSVDEEGRFGEADSRLLATIAANVGVAIQNARLFSEVERQRGYLESLVSISPAAVVVMDAAQRVTD